MHVLTVLGYVRIVRLRSGWWEVRLGTQTEVSKSLPRALWLVGLDTPEARAVAGGILSGTAVSHG